MSKWVRLLGAFVPLLGVSFPWPVVNVAVLPLAGGLIYGAFSTRSRDVFAAPLAALLPTIAVLVYYASVDYVRLIRLFEIAPVVPVLWAASWILFFSLGAVAGYLLSKKTKI